jgi:hypothetical protein
MPTLVGAWALFAIGSKWNGETISTVCYVVSAIFVLEAVLIAVWRVLSIIKARKFQV